MKTKTINNRTKNGKLNFSVISARNLLGERFTANTIGELFGKLPSRLKTSWGIIAFRNDEGSRICITREFMDEGGMTIEETIVDWLENVSDNELEEPINALGPNFGELLEW